MGQRHDVQQVIESGQRVAQAAGDQTRIAVAHHHLATKDLLDAANAVELAASLLRMMAAERRAELEASQGSEQGPH